MPGQKLRIRIIVIYTCDVEEAEDIFDLGAISLKIEQAFLSRIDGDAEFEKISRKVQAGEKLSDEDLMRLVILPLTKKGTPAKIEMVDEVIATASKMQQIDETGTSFVLSAMYVATGNYITPEQEERIKEVLDMTSLGRRYEQEKQQYGDYRAAEVYVNLVDKKVKTSDLTEREACDLLGVDYETYKMAKAVLLNNQQLVTA